MQFRNEYYFLSNMFPCSVRTHSYTFKCVEAAFQACKCPERVAEFVNLDGYQAKRLGRQVPLRPDWDQVKDKFMFALLKRKFSQHPELMAKLKQVNQPIVEDNYWNDTYWGVCRGKGLNKLGQMLTIIKNS